MKSRRKIWSIPIAALAIVLMLAGALAVSGIAQAATEGVTLMDPAGNEVQLVLAADDDAIGKTRAASYEFAYDNGDVLEAAEG